MSIVKLNNRGVKDATAFGSISSLGELVFISKQTASSSATISFTSGIDSTYKEYIFYFVNIHPANDDISFEFNGSTDGGSNYNVTKTTTFFNTYHNEAGSGTSLAYGAGGDLVQSTSFQRIIAGVGNGNDESGVGVLRLFNPSDTTFVTHFNSTAQRTSQTYTVNDWVSGYFNTTSAINAIQFKFNTGNIDAGDIILFGLN